MTLRVPTCPFLSTLTKAGRGAIYASLRTQADTTLGFESINTFQLKPDCILSLRVHVINTTKWNQNIRMIHSQSAAPKLGRRRILLF